MNITFLVGNGFDLSLGLDTSYNGFYNWYIDRPSRTDAIAAFKAELDAHMHITDPEERKRSRWSDFEMGLGEFTEEFSQKEGRDFIDIVEDAREEISTYLDLECKKHAKMELTPSEIEDLQRGIYLFFRDFLRNNERVGASVWRRVRFSYDNTINIQFVSFNYTNTLDDVVRTIANNPRSYKQYPHSAFKMDIMPQVLHVHGRTSNTPILGVSSLSQVKNNEIISVPGLREALIKGESVQAIGVSWYNDADNLIKKSDIICIWGMSLGESDAFWWRRIKNWLWNKPRARLVIFGHMSEPTKRTIGHRVATNQELIRRFIEGAQCPQDTFNSISDRIHIVLNSTEVLNLSSPTATAESAEPEEAESTHV